MAEAMAQVGANIVIADINLKQAEEACSKLSAYGTKCTALVCDVSDEASARETVNKTLDQFGAIDVLVNNAGICIYDNAEIYPLSDWQQVMRVNLDGVFIMSKAVAPSMIERRSGSIINISSMSGFVVNTPQNQAAYNTSKAGVIQLTKSLAMEWAQHNIRVNTIAPGYMKTEMTKPVFDENGEMVKRWMNLSPLGRPGIPEELGGTVVYLASEASSFTTGSVVVVDGGYSCW